MEKQNIKVEISLSAVERGFTGNCVLRCFQSVLCPLFFNLNLSQKKADIILQHIFIFVTQ